MTCQTSDYNSYEFTMKFILYKLYNDKEHVTFCLFCSEIKTSPDLRDVTPNIMVILY